MGVRARHGGEAHYERGKGRATQPDLTRPECAHVRHLRFMTWAFDRPYILGRVSDGGGHRKVAAPVLRRRRKVQRHARRIQKGLA